LRAEKLATGDVCTTETSPRLHSAPNGLLRYYILHKIAEKPLHGYEVIQDIDSKTEGAWRPGAGSLYPILKKMESQGLIKSEERTAEESSRRVYHITPKGSETLAESKGMFADFQQRWGFLRRIMIELIDPEDMATHFVDSSNRQFQLARELLERRRGKFPEKDMEYMLREYVLGLERQLSWAKEMIGEQKPRLVASLARQKGTRRP
jgi:DNA-binding PadR family transcriptional regulator